jgi:Biotin-requiring enzyme
MRQTSPSTMNANILISGLHATSVSRAITKFKMPAMSPTMTEGGIASWKKGEGDSFTAGDVLLEIVCHEQRLIAVVYLR